MTETAAPPNEDAPPDPVIDLSPGPWQEGDEERGKGERRPRWMRRFLVELCKRGVVGHAATLAGVTTKTCYDWRNRQTPIGRAFKEAWDGAIEMAYDTMEATTWDRAMDPTDPGFDPSPSAGLLKWLLESYRPGKYGRNRGSLIGPVYILQIGDHPKRQISSLDDLHGLSDAELEALANNDVTVIEGDATMVDPDL